MINKRVQKLGNVSPDQSGLWQYFQALRQDTRFMHYFLLYTGTTRILSFRQQTTINY